MDFNNIAITVKFMKRSLDGPFNVCLIEGFTLKWIYNDEGKFIHKSN